MTFGKGAAVIGALAAAGVAALVLWTTAPTGDHEQTKAAGGGTEGAAIVAVRVPAEFSPLARTGKAAFEAKCAACHGKNASGIEGKGPPLVHKYYHPGHHGDAAFFRAARNGVRSHHWRFGDMPPVEGLTDADIKAIVRYVRELQKENGIF